MRGIVKRLLKSFEARAHALIDDLEDPIQLSEQAIRDLKDEFTRALKSLAEIKANTSRLNAQIESRHRQAADYEGKARLLLQKAQHGALSAGEAERLATEALIRREEMGRHATHLSMELTKHHALQSRLEEHIKQLKAQIEQWEDELSTLKVRANVAQSSRRIHEHLSHNNVYSSMALLQRMQAKVAEAEAFALAYAELDVLVPDLDQEIHQALAYAPGTTPPHIAQQLAQLQSDLPLVGFLEGQSAS